MSNLDDFLIKKFWAQLWNSDKPFYLPTVVKTGYHVGSIKIDSIDQFSIPDIKNLSIHAGSETALVSLTKSCVKNMSNVQNGGVQYSPAITNNQAQVNFKLELVNIALEGTYEVRVEVCATAVANSLLFPATILANTSYLRLTDSDDRLQTARDYEAKLNDEKQSGASGKVLLSKFHTHNDLLCEILHEKNAFTDAWTTYRTANKTTAFFADQTNEAAKDPKNSNKKINDHDYNGHGIYINTQLLNVISDKKDAYKGPSPNPYEKLYNDILDFLDQSNATGRGPVTVEEIMTAVKEHKSIINFSANPPRTYEDWVEKHLSSNQRAIVNKANQDFQARKRKHNAKATSLGEELNSTLTISSTYHVNIGKIEIGLCGSITDNLTSPVHIDSCNFNVVTDIDIQLDDPHTNEMFYKKLVEAVKNGDFVKNLIRTKVSGSMKDKLQPYIQSCLDTLILGLF